MVQDEDVREFLIESNENLAMLDRQLVELEERPEDTMLLSGVFRTVHTIKGTSGFFGFDKLGGITHVAENILSQLRDRQRQLTPELASLILESVDAVKAILATIEATGSEGEDAYTGLRLRLEAAYRGEGMAPASREKAATAAGLADRVEDSSLEIPLEDDLLPDEPYKTPFSTAPAAGVPAAAVSAKPAAAVREPNPEPGRELAPEPRPESSPGSSHKQSRAPGEEAAPASSALSDSTIRVDVHLLDKLMNLVGELVLARNQLIQDTSTENSPLTGASQRLNQITSELQEGVMKMRMQPIGVVWNKLPRVVRDLAAGCGKKIQIEMDGAETELDKTIIEAIKDPLTHIVRNSCDHGIEPPEVRLQRGKNGTGRILLRAYHEGGHVNIEISDDGGGIDAERVKAKARDKGLMRPEELAQLSDREATQLIFLPGFSTAEKVTNISGRGVGMDVVRTNIEKIAGTVDVFNNPHAGMTVRIKIPLTLAIIPGLVVAVEGSVGGNGDAERRQRFVIPQANLLELVRIEGEQELMNVQQVHGTPVYQHRGKLLPLAYLHRVLGLAKSSEVRDVMNIIVLQVDDRQLGLVVDHISDTQEIVVKPLGKELKALNCYVGATIMGDGKVALILDAAGIARLAGIGPRSRESGKTDNMRTGEEHRQAQRLLLFSAGGYPRLAAPLALVARLEEFPATRLERASGSPVLHYRGQILPLLRLETVLAGGTGMPAGRGFAGDSSTGDSPMGDGSLGEGSSGSMLVIVFSDGVRSIGVVVDHILDIVKGAITVSRPSTTAGLLGSAVIGDALTDFIDLDALVRMGGDNWWEAPQYGRAQAASVLLVAPSLMVRETLRGVLEISGYRVSESAELPDAVNRLLRGGIDAVVSALSLSRSDCAPGGDGWEFLETIRGHDRLKQLPVIALADDGGQGELQSATGCRFERVHSAHDREGLLRSISALMRRPDAASMPVGVR